ncbi:MAG: DUF2845 domain-containing protein [Nitrospirota bacterium]
MKSYMFICLAVLMSLPMYGTAYADTMSCSGGIISIDDRSSDIISKCGSPYFQESYQEEVSQRIDRDTKYAVLITVEKWTYNFGPNQLMRIVTLKNGTVTEIQTGNYGFDK